MQSVIKHFKAVLRFLSLLDRQGNISATNATLFVLTVKLAIAPQFSIPEIAAFFMALVNYGHKRHAASKAAKDETTQQVATQQAAIDTLVEELSTVKSSVGDLKAIQEEVKKIAAATQNTALHQAMNNPRAWRTDK